jgi:hypothetical protein
MKETQPDVVAAKFLASQRAHQVSESALDIDADEMEPDAPSDVEEAAEPLLRALAADRVARDVESILEWGRRLGVLEVQANVALLLAMFVTARQRGACQMRAGQHTAGDHLNDITEITIEVGARRSDFDLEFLVTWHELGPHPDWRSGEERGEPHTLEVTKEMAVICDNPPSGEFPSDQKTRRAGLSSLGLLVFSYRREEAEHDPYGLAARAVGELWRVVNEEFIP